MTHSLPLSHHLCPPVFQPDLSLDLPRNAMFLMVSLFPFFLLEKEAEGVKEDLGSMVGSVYMPTSQ